MAQASNIAKGVPERPKAALEFPSAADFLRVKYTVLRLVVIGFFAGILPGIGPTLAAFPGYSQAQRRSRNKAGFGKGELEGVVASETANNAATGAAMIPLLALGLPGGALTAMILGIFQIHGMEPGPLVFVTSSKLVWVTFAAMFWANLLIVALGCIQTKTVAHILRMAFRWLAPGILLLASIGAHALRNLIIDVWVMFAAGLHGCFLRSTGDSAAVIVLGLNLGKLGDSAFSKSIQPMQRDPAGLFERPIAAALILLGTAAILSSIYNEIRGAGHTRAPDG